MIYSLVKIQFLFQKMLKNVNYW